MMTFEDTEQLFSTSVVRCVKYSLQTSSLSQDRLLKHVAVFSRFGYRDVGFFVLFYFYFLDRDG